MLVSLDRNLRAAIGRLRALTPKIRDKALAAKLSAMRASQEDAAARI